MGMGMGTKPRAVELGGLVVSLTAAGPRARSENKREPGGSRLGGAGRLAPGRRADLGTGARSSPEGRTERRTRSAAPRRPCQRRCADRAASTRRWGAARPSSHPASARIEPGTCVRAGRESDPSIFRRVHAQLAPSREGLMVKKGGERSAMLKFQGRDGSPRRSISCPVVGSQNTIPPPARQPFAARKFPGKTRLPAPRRPQGQTASRINIALMSFIDFTTFS